MGEQSLPIAPEPPVMAVMNTEREEYWRHVDNSVNAVSFGFVATAILISMFLLMAIFEKFLRSRSPSHNNNNSSNSPGDITRLDLENQIVYGGKLDYPSPKVSSLSLITLQFFVFSILENKKGCNSRSNVSAMTEPAAT